MSYKPTSGLTPQGLRTLTASTSVQAKALTTADRKKLPSSSFVFPAKAPGPGSYPIGDREHGANALGRAKGTSDYPAVKRAVCSRYPDLPACRE
jgi:hypothetical protein